MAKFTKTFSQLNRKSVAEAGGKGAQLGEMTRVKMPVPPGFVILSSTFERFLAETDLDVEIDALLKKVNLNDINSVDRVSNTIRDLIHDFTVPEDITKEVITSFNKLKTKYVAVRSSATAEDSSVASWAGELETYLFVTCANLTDAVRKCWSSLFTPRAIFYRFEKKLHKTKVSVGVVVQKMVNSEVSGVTFTAHPVTNDRNQMVIEAGYGQGEAIVSGQITPDTYVFDKKEKAILDVNISEQKEMIVQAGTKGIKKVKVPKAIQERQKLTGKQIVKLATVCEAIEKHYRHPQDIEWAIEKNKIYITQSRPITTLK
ncbi:MAG: PEP/pyruvate-binding domain-containing protein [Patescibacteria group bacterium]|jgi:pyruvate,water dikinase